MSASKNIVLDNNTFFIYNKKYSEARIASWGTDGREVGTFSHEVHPDQMWMIRPHPNHPGYYYIENVARARVRLAKWGAGDSEVGNYDGHFYDDQLWRFERLSDGYYLIYNKKYSNSRIAKWGSDDGDWGTYDGPIHDDQKWKLVPRFDAAVKEVTIWSVDNRQGQNDFSEQVTFTHGVTVKDASTFKMRTGFKYSSKISLGIAIDIFNIGTSASTELSLELEKTTTYEKVEEWSETRTIKFTAPAGTNYRVTQYVSNFESSLGEDNFNVLGSYKVYEED